jgi:hypothetical protein
MQATPIDTWSEHPVYAKDDRRATGVVSGEAVLESARGIGPPGVPQGLGGYLVSLQALLGEGDSDLFELPAALAVARERTGEIAPF